MGNHAKPRTRVRSAAMGALTVGATLTGLGLTAAALDPANALGVNADGTLTGNAVDLAAAGLGSPVPVADAGLPVTGSSVSNTVPAAPVVSGVSSVSGTGQPAVAHGRPIRATTAHAPASGARAVRAPIAQTPVIQAPTVQTPSVQRVIDQVTSVQSAVAPLLRPATQLSSSAPSPSLSTTSSPTSALPAVPALPNLPALPALGPVASALPSLPADVSGLISRVTGLL